MTKGKVENTAKALREKNQASVYMCQHVGTFTSDDGIECSIVHAFGKNAVHVMANGVYYTLSWQDVCELAEAAGFFAEITAEQKIKDKTKKKKEGK